MLRGPGRTIEEFPGLLGRLGRKLLNELALQLRDFRQRLRGRDSLRRIEGGLGVRGHVLHYPLIENLRAGPGGVGDLAYDLRAIQRGGRSLRVDLPGGSDTLLGGSLDVLGHAQILEEYFCLVRGLLSEHLVHGRIPFVERWWPRRCGVSTLCG